MTININELRRLAQAALIGPDGFSMRWLKLLQDFQEEANPATIVELLDRLEVAQSRANQLQAKIKAMEKQEPVAWRRRSDYGWSYKAKPVNGLVMEPLYLAPGAQPAPSVPDAYWKQAVEEISDEGFGAVFKRLISDRAAMLAAYQEPKP